MTIGVVTDAVAKEMSGLGSVVVDALVAELAAREKARVLPMMITVYEKIVAQTKALEKIRPDINVYNDGGTLVSANWSRKALDEKTKAQKTLATLTAAFEKAMGGDFTEVAKHANAPKGDTNVRNGDET